MNPLIEMSIQGGRYLEAEKQVGDIILSEPSAEAYFMLGTVKSNLLLDKGRSYLEVQFCFDKYLEMSNNRSQAEKDVMVFCVGLYSQLAELEKKLQEQKKKEAWNAALGVLVTFAASKIIDNSKQSFGAISGIVGAGFGVGISMDSLSNIGSLSDILAYVIRIKVEMIDYLKTCIKNELRLFESEILTLGEKYGNVAQVDSSVDVSELKTVLGINFVPPTEAIALVQIGERHATQKTWHTKGFLKNTPFQVPVGENVLFGFKSNKNPNLMEYLFTTKGVYIMNNPKLMPYNKVSFKHNLATTIGHNRLFGLQSRIDNQSNIIDALNNFISTMK